MKITYTAIALIALASASWAGAPSEPYKAITENELKSISDAVYSQMISGALKRGHHFAPELIEKGFNRHFQELRLQLLDDGYVILKGEAGI